MRKILFGTSALLAAGAFVSAAQASEPVKLSLGGYMEYWVAAADQDNDTLKVNSFDVQGESEIWFVGKTTLDNGITVGVQVELEAGSNYNGDDTIDESYLWLEGKYGKLIVGSENDVSYLTSVNAPEASDLGVGIDESDTNKFLLIPTTVSYLEPVQSTFTADANKLSYFTPRFYGFQAGVSYVPSNNTSGDDGSAASETIAKDARFDEAWAFAVSYRGEFSGVGVKANVGYTILNPNGSDAAATGSKHDNVNDYGGGLQVSYQGFTIGGSYREFDGKDSGIQGNATRTGYTELDGSAWDLGVQYAEGPYAVSFSYTSSQVEGAVGGGEDEVDLWKLGAKYALGPGVNLFGQVAYLEAEDETGTANLGNEGAWGGAVGLRLVF